MNFIAAGGVAFVDVRLVVVVAVGIVVDDGFVDAGLVVVADVGFVDVRFVVAVDVGFVDVVVERGSSDGLIEVAW